MNESKTLQNLMNAFAGESQANQRYEMYAKIAKKEGWSNIAEIFNETARNEYYHAKEFYKLMIEIVGEENIPEVKQVDGSYPIAIKSTYDNLLYAAAGENEEVVMYSDFAKIAKEEGFNEAAKKFELVSEVENFHAKRYEKYAGLLEVDQVVKREEKVYWQCLQCGHIHEGTGAPSVCPICNHEQGYFVEVSK